MLSAGADTRLHRYHTHTHTSLQRLPYSTKCGFQAGLHVLVSFVQIASGDLLFVNAL